MPYLRNSIYDHDFWCTYVKLYLHAFFHFFKIFIFQIVSGVYKRGKITQNEKKILPVAFCISGTIHRVVIYGTLAWSDDISRWFFDKMTKHSVCYASYLANHASYDQRWLVNSQLPAIFGLWTPIFVM